MRRIRLRSRNKSVVADGPDRTGIAISAEHSTAPKGPTIILCIACSHAVARCWSGECNEFHRLHSASAQFAPAWLHRAAAHTALNRLRGRRRREKRELAQAPEEAARTVDPQRMVEGNQDRRLV